MQSNLWQALALRQASLPGEVPRRAVPGDLPAAGRQELRLRADAAPHALLPAPQVPLPSAPAPCSRERPHPAALQS